MALARLLYKPRIDTNERESSHLVRVHSQPVRRSMHHLRSTSYGASVVFLSGTSGAKEDPFVASNRRQYARSCELFRLGGRCVDSVAFYRPFGGAK
jgi:hypothetical protein